MNCPECYSPEYGVTDSREYKNYRIRRRKCGDCGSKYSTYEVSARLFKAYDAIFKKQSEIRKCAKDIEQNLNDVVDDFDPNGR